MKHLNKLVLGVIAAFALTACSGGSSSKSDIFGNVPELLEKYRAEKAALKEKGENIKTQEEKAKLIEESKKVDEEYAEKIEKASIELDGKTLDVTGENIEITSPMTLNFDGWSSKRSLTPQFKVTGEAKTTTEFTLEKQVFSTKCPVLLLGIDAEGNEVFHLTTGTIDVNTENGTTTVAAGTPVEFSKISVNPEYLEGYQTAKTLKLVVRPLW